jgi:hypothetical protein
MMRSFLAVTVCLLGCDKGKKEPAPTAAPPAQPAPAAPAAAAPAPTPPPAAPGSAASSIGAVARAIAAGGAVQNEAKSATKVPCSQAAKDVKGNAGTSWYMQCPAQCPGEGMVWGTDVYTDDSGICSAAIHAGAITANEGGVVLVTWAPKQPTYIGTARNGITTHDYGAWGRSFFVQKVDAGGQPTTPAPPLVTATNTAHLSCHHGAGALIGEPGAKWQVDCPAKCAPGALWGSDPYTDDSSVCTAAMHAGVIDQNGGPLVVTIDGPGEKFEGTVKNGITSNSYGKYGRTYHVAKP